MNGQSIRDFKKEDYRIDKILVGERNGFKRYIVLIPRDRYVNGSAPAGFGYTHRELCLQTNFALEKDNTWIVWNPGWGVDIHKPVKFHEHQDKTEDCSFTGGDCYCDGSALADGERLWPAWKNNLEDVWTELEGWLR